MSPNAPAEPEWSEIAPGLFVGSHPARSGALDATLQAMRSRGATAVVSVLERGIESSALNRAGLEGLHLPVFDGEAPTPEQLESALAFIGRHRGEGGGVLVHCAAGIGRSATVACAVLIEEGQEVLAAIGQVRRRRHPSCVESAAQRASLLELAERLGRR